MSCSCILVTWSKRILTSDIDWDLTKRTTRGPLDFNSCIAARKKRNFSIHKCNIQPVSVWFIKLLSDNGVLVLVSAIVSCLYCANTEFSLVCLTVSWSSYESKIKRRIDVRQMKVGGALAVIVLFWSPFPVDVALLTAFSFRVHECSYAFL